MPVLPRDERHQLDARCDLLVSDALAALAAFTGAAEPEQWRPLAQREHFAYYTHAPPTAGNRRFLVSGYLTGSLAQVTSGLYCDSSRDLTLQQCVLLAEAGGATHAAERQGTNAAAPSDRLMFLDAAVLHVGEQENRHAPFRFAGVKWYAWRSSAGADRDLLAYERSGVAALDADDHYHNPSHSSSSNNNNNNDSTSATEIMYHVVQSIERPLHGLDGVTFPPGRRHMKLSVCYLYRQVCDDLVECFAVGEYPALRRGGANGGANGVESTLQRVEDGAVAERVLTVARVLAAYSAKRLSRLIEKNRKLPVIMGKSCLRCSARRTVFDPLRTCSICKKSVCQSCRQEKTIFKLNIDTNRPETEVFCRKCLQCSKLPDATPVSLEELKQQKKKSRVDSGERSSPSQPPVSGKDRRRNRTVSGSSAGSGGGRRDSIGSAGSSSMASSLNQRHAQQDPRSRHNLKQERAPVTVDGPNYEGLFRNQVVDKPVATRPRSSTLPSSSDSSSASAGFAYNRSTIVGVVATGREVSDDNFRKHQQPEQQQQPVRKRLQPLALPVAAEAVDVAVGEEVVMGESLRDTQIGLPVILVDVKDDALRRTQLGVPVEIELGLMSDEPSPRTAAQPQQFLGVDVDSDLYSDFPNAPAKSASGGTGVGVEKRYQTYLERREKLQTEAADEQQLRNTRLEVSRMHVQQQQQRQAVKNNSTSVGGNQSQHDRSAVVSSPYAQLEANQSPYRSLLHQPSRRQPNRLEPPPPTQHFRMDLYSQP
ncbi:hypothetical protein PybrP1_003266 [[Pythium] brassicae (nom. inval.)]|nr:hypothetical protein PybrP1_003266 [[Pythium] brassicae (nom. inval.)]